MDTHTETIRCPECRNKEEATVEHTFPNLNYEGCYRIFCIDGFWCGCFGNPPSHKLKKKFLNLDALLDYMLQNEKP